MESRWNENSQQQAVTSALLNCVTFLYKQGISELINGTEHEARGRGGTRTVGMAMSPKVGLDDRKYEAETRVAR